MTILETNNLANTESRVDKKHTKFIEEYIKTGNATKAFITAYKLPRSKYHSATVRASKLKQNYPNLDRLYFEYTAGINAKKLSQVIKDALNAKKQVIYKGITEYPDHSTRLRAVEVFDRLMNKEDKTKNNNFTVLTGLNIIIKSENTNTYPEDK